MIVKVGNEFIDTTVTPFAIAFSTKEEAEAVGNIIANIEKGDSKCPNDYMWFMMTPKGMSKDDVDEWAQLSTNGKIVDSIVSGELQYKL